MMQDLTARALIVVHRRVHRHPRLHQWLVSLVNRSIGEKRVNAAILKLTRPDDCVWDVGANVSFYTRRFLDRAGPSGRVVAFEPVPANAEQLRALATTSRLTVVEVSLAASDGQMPFIVRGENGQTSHIGAATDALSVRVARGDSLLMEGIPRPDVVKIDVEGFEGDVLDGLPVALRAARGVVVEMHFAALARRDRPQQPIRILQLLRGHGFTVRWLDSSHVGATR